MSFDDSKDYCERPIRDAIHGAVFDEQGEAYILFTRSRPTALVATPWAMAQSVDDRLFRLTNVECTRTSDGATSTIVLADARELYENAFVEVFTLVGLQSVQPSRPRDQMPNDYWRHLSVETMVEAWAQLRK